MMATSSVLIRIATAGLFFSFASRAAQPVPAGMVRVPSGTFVRGHTNPSRPDEGPRHRVAVRSFFLDATLVTRQAFAAYVAATGAITSAEQLGYGMGSNEGMDDWAWERIPNASWRRPFWEFTADHNAFLHPDAPVVMVSFSDAEAYCSSMGKRLPTEAEWEYAMRAGAQGTRFPWGQTPERANRRLGFNFWQGPSHHHNTRQDGYVYVSPVKAFPPNAWGIFDSVGNVWQWTSDWYDAATYANAASGTIASNPQGPPTGTKRVLRGGSWWCGACTCEGYGLFYRGKADPSAPFNNNGFRCAMDTKNDAARAPAR